MAYFFKQHITDSIACKNKEVCLIVIYVSFEKCFFMKLSNTYTPMQIIISLHIFEGNIVDKI